VKRSAAAARTSKAPCLSRLPATKAGNPTKALCRAKAFAPHPVDEPTALCSLLKVS